MSLNGSEQNVVSFRSLCPGDKAGGGRRVEGDVTQYMRRGGRGGGQRRGGMH